MKNVTFFFISKKVKNGILDGSLLKNGKKYIEQLDRADAHPYGLRPFKREDYIKKFQTLTNDIIDKKESKRFLKLVQNLKKLKPGKLKDLNIVIKKNKIKRNTKEGIF